MSPRTADPRLRTTLIETAARVLAEEGPAALTSRRLAAEVGSSTMAVFSRFQNMAEIRRAVRQEGFVRLDARLDALPASDDPVADLAAASAVFFASGVANPHLYRAMFLDPPPEDDNLGAGTFDRLVALVRRCIAAGRFPAAQEFQVPVWAAQLWSMRHGLVVMTVAQLLPHEQVRFVLDDMTFRLLVGYGDDPARARRSIEQGNRAAAAADPS
ncbi:TetR/AcrR family transcriptional regulator [Lentzea sp. PSKA42]|uniref:TetR/AcrR family transcriptional regulator n=1 Tax=Lentzea indica TaxID=2604800 RepID=A0ABX1FKQ5_9PSEU|nr:WHG domain-containing protein [Lentzea indica]NKE59571.1 TetR/AcrR family transcriptional regulator [Lentzea indica]